MMNCTSNFSYQLNMDAATVEPCFGLQSPRSALMEENGHAALPSGHVEERVQVDRKKLEQMIVGHNGNQIQSDTFPSAAETFFTSVMRTTSTVITWPTKLKVGAKTKKDPFVKITGRPEDVERAKKLVLAMLETKHNRVTIKIDVAFTDHSHIIGKQGRNTQLAMKQTACHIHFPDSNRNPDLEKSNMVSIAGPMQTVDHARRILRELSPLAISIEIKACCDDQLLLNEDPLVKELSNGATGIAVSIRTNRNSGSPVFLIRGSIFQTPLIRTAVLRLQQRFLNTVQAICTTTMEILQQQHTFVMGSQNANIQLISQRTGAVIHCPRGDTGPASNSTTFLIQGTIDAILSARKHLVGCLPMSFVFETKSDLAESPNAVSDLEKQYGVSISLRPKRNGDSTNVIIKGQERQATMMYEVRRRMVKGAVEEMQVVATDLEFMRDFDINAALMRSGSATPSLSLPTMQQSPTSTLPINAPMISPIASPAIFGFPAFCSTTSLYSPLPPAPMPSPSILDTPLGTICPNSGYSPISEPPTLKALTQIAPGARYEEQTSVSSRSSPNAAGGTDSAGVLNANDPVPGEAPLACGLLEAAKKIQETSNNWKAPGAERNATSVNFDYDQQRLRASKAMQEKPLGLRVPTQQWSGLGFSRSMPAPVLRYAKACMVEKSIDFGESSASSSSSGPLQTFDEDEEDKIGPWPLENHPTNLSVKEAFNMTTYFDSVHLPRPTNNVSLADIDDMAILLSHLHLTKYVDTFREQEVDMNAFLTMTDADLKELGVNTFGARRKLLVAIQEIKEHRRHFR